MDAVKQRWTELAIANGQSKSATLRLDGEVPTWLRFPAAMTGTHLFIQVASTVAEPADSDFGPLADPDSPGSAYAVPFVANMTAPLKLVTGLMWLRVQSSSSGASLVAAAEGAARAVQVGRRGFD